MISSNDYDGHFLFPRGILTRTLVKTTLDPKKNRGAKQADKNGQPNSGLSLNNYRSSRHHILSPFSAQSIERELFVLFR